jgi:hypothetical protein
VRPIFAPDASFGSSGRGTGFAYRLTLHRTQGSIHNSVGS